MSRALRLFSSIVATCVLLTACGGSSSSGDRQQAIAAAQQVYQQSKAQGTDFSSGPCIAEQLPTLPDWSVDVAHNPRKPIDDQPSNQCQDYRQGKTRHFVELDPDGNLIRAQ
ncbi:MAG: hypothetical protein WBW04_09565 [Nitrolancea sp.]